MTMNTNGTARTQLVSAALAVVLGIVALRWVRNGKRLRGALAGGAAVAVGYNAFTTTAGDTTAADVDVARESSTPSGGRRDDEPSLSCAACGDAIRTGQRRRPNENHETVHEACLEATA